MENMNLTKPTITRILNALKSYRQGACTNQRSETVTLSNSQDSPVSSQGSERLSQSQPSLVSLGSGAFQPGLFEV